MRSNYNWLTSWQRLFSGGKSLFSRGSTAFIGLSLSEWTPTEMYIRCKYFWPFLPKARVHRKAWENWDYSIYFHWFLYHSASTKYELHFSVSNSCFSSLSFETILFLEFKLFINVNLTEQRSQFWVILFILMQNQFQNYYFEEVLSI